MGILRGGIDQCLHRVLDQLHSKPVDLPFVWIPHHLNRELYLGSVVHADLSGQELCDPQVL